MSSPIIVPDTGILLAIGLGKELDEKAELATQSIDLAVAAGRRVIAPPSVSLELEAKLQNVDAIFEVIQHLVSTLPNPQGLSTLKIVEELMLELRASVKGPGSRVVNVIESELIRTIGAAPGLSLNAAFAVVAGNMLVVREVVRIKSRPAAIDFVSLPEANPSPLPNPIPEVSGMDLAHIRACEWLGTSEACTVILLVFERTLHKHRDEIHERFPHVVVTTPHYLPAYL